MKGTPQDKKCKQAKGALGSGPANLQRMNRKQRREWVRKIQADDISLEIVHPDAAGIDIGNECHYVAVPSKRDPEHSVRRFGCVTAELKEMAEWLKQCGIRTVAMQSTGVYWIPVYDVLEEAKLEVYLVNARDTKNLPGKKSDVQESQWLMKLHTYGLLRSSFRPVQEIRRMRNYWRQRNDLIRSVSFRQACVGPFRAGTGWAISQRNRSCEIGLSGGVAITGSGADGGGFTGNQPAGNCWLV